MHVGLHVKCPLFLSDFNEFNFLHRFSKNTHTNFTKILPVEAELFQADGQTDKYDETNSRFSQFCEIP